MAEGESECCQLWLEVAGPGIQGIGWRIGARPAGKHSFDHCLGVWTLSQGP